MRGRKEDLSKWPTFYCTCINSPKNHKNACKHKACIANNGSVLEYGSNEYAYVEWTNVDYNLDELVPSHEKKLHLSKYFWQKSLKYFTTFAAKIKISLLLASGGRLFASADVIRF